MQPLPKKDARLKKSPNVQNHNRYFPEDFFKSPSKLSHRQLPS